MTASNYPRPPWPSGDERGMGNLIGPETWMRCAPYLGNPKAKCYELSHRISGTMPMSPYSKPLTFTARATRGMRNSVHSSNMDQMSGEPGGQGTHIDALGHFGFVPDIWDGSGDYPVDQSVYYGGFTQAAGHFAFAISSGSAIELPQGVRLAWLLVVHLRPSAQSAVV